MEPNLKLLLVCMFWQLNETSIIVDASKYIEELKQKVESLNQNIVSGQSSNSQQPLPKVYIYIYMNFIQLFNLMFNNF